MWFELGEFNFRGRAAYPSVLPLGLYPHRLLRSNGVILEPLFNELYSGEEGCEGVVRI